MLQLTGRLKGQQTGRGRWRWPQQQGDLGEIITGNRQLAVQVWTGAPQHLERHLMWASTSDPWSRKNKQISQVKWDKRTTFLTFPPPSRPLLVITASDTFSIQHPPQCLSGVQCSGSLHHISSDLSSSAPLVYHKSIWNKLMRPVDWTCKNAIYLLRLQ